MALLVLHTAAPSLCAACYSWLGAEPSAHALFGLCHLPLVRPPPTAVPGPHSYEQRQVIAAAVHRCAAAAQLGCCAVLSRAGCRAVHQVKHTECFLPPSPPHLLPIPVGTTTQVRRGAGVPGWRLGSRAAGRCCLFLGCSPGVLHACPPYPPPAASLPAGSLYNDIALLLLDRPSFKQPMSLPSGPAELAQRAPVGAKMLSIGFGSERRGGGAWCVAGGGKKAGHPHVLAPAPSPPASVAVSRRDRRHHGPGLRESVAAGERAGGVCMGRRTARCVLPVRALWPQHASACGAATSRCASLPPCPGRSCG